MYYRASLGPRARADSRDLNPVGDWHPPTDPEILLEDTTGATAEQLVPSDGDNFVAQLNNAAGRWAWWPWALVALAVVALALPSPFGAIVFVLGIPVIAWLFLRDRARRSVVAFYQVEGPQAAWFASLVEAFEHLSQSAALWRVNAAGDVTTTHQYKTNSGASTIISRATAQTGLRGPKFLVTNIAVPGISSGRSSLHFLPDRLLVRDGRRFASVSYAHLNTDASSTRFIEAERVPRDARQVDTTWQYVNVKGGPDRRFKNNRELPILLYGRLTLTSPDGLRWIVDGSYLDSVTQVATTLANAAAPPEITHPTNQAAAQ